MSDPYGGPFPPWVNTTAYALGDRVTHRGYIYEAMDATTAGQEPGVATKTFTLSNSAVGVGGTEDVDFPLWRLWDYPAEYYMARLRGVPDFALSSLTSGSSPLPEEVRTVIVRAEYQNNGQADADLYHQPTTASYSGYGMPAGMDTNWDDPERGELVWSFSAAGYAFDNGLKQGPKTYQYNLGLANGLCFQPSTIMGHLSPNNDADIAVLPAWYTETQGQMISCYQTFSRQFTFSQPGDTTDDFTTVSFQDEWIDAATVVDDAGDTLGTAPDYEDT